MNKPKLTKLQKYHLDHVSKSEVSKVIAVTPAAMEIEKRAIAREKKGQFRVAARLWLLCMGKPVRRSGGAVASWVCAGYRRNDASI